jgi:hypothetical protein
MTDSDESANVVHIQYENDNVLNHELYDVSLDSNLSDLYSPYRNIVHTPKLVEPSKRQSWFCCIF